MPLEHRRYNAIPTEYDPVLKLMLDEVIELKSPHDDPKVLKLVSALLEPPSQHILKFSRPVVETKQSQEVMKILNNKVPLVDILHEIQFIFSSTETEGLISRADGITDLSIIRCCPPSIVIHQSTFALKFSFNHSDCFKWRTKVYSATL